MDNYPEHLAPDFEEGDGVATPFEEWWPRVQHAFPTVPEEVARHWLHEHWSHSPYSWLRSADYSFELVDWPADELALIRSRWCDFCENNADCLAHGKHLMQKPAGWRYRTAVYMDEHSDFPTPIIVLDNRDAHLQEAGSNKPTSEDLPAAYVLIEGHRRFNMALYLHSIGRFNPTPMVWLMRPMGEGLDGISAL